MVGKNLYGDIQVYNVHPTLKLHKYKFPQICSDGSYHTIFDSVFEHCKLFIWMEHCEFIDLGTKQSHITVATEGLGTNTSTVQP